MQQTRKTIFVLNCERLELAQNFFIMDQLTFSHEKRRNLIQRVMDWNGAQILTPVLSFRRILLRQCHGTFRQSRRKTRCQDLIVSYHRSVCHLMMARQLECVQAVQCYENCSSTSPIWTLPSKREVSYHF